MRSVRSHLDIPQRLQSGLDLCDRLLLVLDLISTPRSVPPGCRRRLPLAQLVEIALMLVAPRRSSWCSSSVESSADARAAAGRGRRLGSARRQRLAGYSAAS